MSIPSAKKSQRGRPSVDTEAVNVRLERIAIGKLDDWRRDQNDMPTRPEAIRRLIEAGLGKIGADTFDDLERSKLAMLADINAMESGRISPVRGQTRKDGDVQEAVAEARRQIAVLEEAKRILEDGARGALSNT